MYTEWTDVLAAGVLWASQVPANLANPAALGRILPDGCLDLIWADGELIVVGLGARQLHRRSLPAFGYGPKTLARVLRFNRALGLARAGTAFATVAASTGYADQAHLAREVRQFADVPLSTLLQPDAS